LIVPLKRANGPRPEPGEGSEASDHGTLLRNTTNASTFDPRVHETGADSSVGETVAGALCGSFSSIGCVIHAQPSHDLKNRML